MARFTKFVALAQRLIQKNGRTVTLVFPSTTFIDPAQPFLGKTDSTDEVQVKAVFTEYSRNDQRNSNDGLPTNIQVGDKQCLIALGDVPSKNITTSVIIKDRTIEWKIVTVSNVDPGDDPILAKVQVRA